MLENDVWAWLFFGDPWWPPSGVTNAVTRGGHQGVTKERFLGSPIRSRGSPNILNVQNGSKSTVMDWCLKLWLESFFGSIPTILSCLFTPHHYHIIKITLWWNCFQTQNLTLTERYIKVLVWNSSKFTHKWKFEKIFRELRFPQIFFRLQWYVYEKERLLLGL